MTDVPRTRLEEVLADKCRTKTDIARKVGVSRKTLNRWASGRDPVPEDRWSMLADELGVPVVDLREDGVAA